MIFKCDRCGVEHDYEKSRDELVKTIAHLHYHAFEDLGFTNTPDGNMRFGEGAVAWFDGRWNDEHDYFDDLVESGYAQFAPYYLSWRESHERKSPQSDTRTR
jgi:hypothetical protein